MKPIDLHSDQLFKDLADRFIRALPSRLDGLRCAIEREAHDETMRLAHQLCGAGGGYGFPDVSIASGEVEQACLRGEALAVALSRLEAACEAAIAEWTMR